MLIIDTLGLGIFTSKFSYPKVHETMNTCMYGKWVGMLMAFVSFTKIQRQGFFGLWPNVVSQKIYVIKMTLK